MNQKSTTEQGLPSSRVCMAGLLLCMSLLLANGRNVLAQEMAMDNDYAELDLEQLMQINVTSVAGVEQSWFKTPAAMYVLTAEDIRRTGHLSIPEILRLVPGMQVAQISPSQWAVSSRGFNNRLANKLLVMIDGRTIYTPLFGGVYWDAQDVVLEDLDRIEVIRGPGATLWGANAVNGVINITTRNAKDTQGLLITGGTGTYNRGFGTVRYGGQLGEDVYYRAYGKYFNRDRFDTLTGATGVGDWDMNRGGFRVDGQGSENYQWTVQGDIYHSNRIGAQARKTSPVPFTTLLPTTKDTSITGNNLLGRLTYTESEDAGWQLQAYYDYTARRSISFDEFRNTFDVDFRQHFALGDRHAIVWGMGFRHTRDSTNDSFTLRFDPLKRQSDTYSLFVQDNIELIDEKLYLMLGSKFEHNDYTGIEVQPGARLAWTPDDKQTLWASFSKAVRTPTRSDDDFGITVAVLPGPTPITIKGGGRTESEDLLAHEIGYRIQPHESWTVDMTAFYNKYDNLVTFDHTKAGDPFTVLSRNNASAKAYGFELASTWQVAENLRLSAGYTWLKLKEQSRGVASGNANGASPNHQFNIRSFLDITEYLELNAALYVVSGVEEYDIPSYTRLDVGMTWRPNGHTEIALWGQNLLDDEHVEFAPPSGASSTAIPRSVYAQVTFKF